MMSVTVRRTLRESIPVALEELRDSWAIAVAEVTAFLAYRFGRTELEAVAVGIAVLAVRVAAGFFLPVDIPIRRTPRVPMRDRQIRSHHAKGMSVSEIARLMKVTERYVRRVLRDMAESSMAGGNKPPQKPHWYEHPLVRGTVTAGGFLGLAWTLFQMCRLSGVC